MGFETEFIARRGILQANVKLRQIQANESLRSKVKSSLLKHVGLYEAPRREAQSAAFRAKASREEQDKDRLVGSFERFYPKQLLCQDSTAIRHDQRTWVTSSCSSQQIISWVDDDDHQFIINPKDGNCTN
ncbi:hypothetical protein FCV25MIE_06321 [Fagus crenata]